MREDDSLSVHQANFMGFFRTQMAPLCLAVFGVFLLLIALFVPVKEGPQVAFWMGTISALGAVGCLVYAVVAYSLLIKQVTLYPDRVEWNNQVASWEDITDVWRTEIIVNGTMSTRQVVIKTHDGVEATFTYILSHWERMAETIQSESAKVIGPEALADFSRGKTVKFGDVSVSQKGVTICGKLVPWDAVERTTISNGHYCVFRPGEEWSSLQVSLGSTPNFLVFLRLLEETPHPPSSGPEIRRR